MSAFDSNPFADPSVTQAANGAGSDVSEYNPFDGSRAPAYGVTTHEPPRLGLGAAEKSPIASNSAYGSATSSSVSHASPSSSSSSVDIEALRLREQNLLRREQLLVDREKNLEARERDITINGVKINNWPFSCWPIAYHSIETEIPAQYQSQMRQFYVLMLVTWLTLFWNWICVLTMTFIAYNQPIESLWATIYFALGVPGAWTFWYRSIYYALRDSSTSRWIRFFFYFACSIIFALVMCIGVPQTAAGGLIYMSKLLADGNTKTGLATLVAFVLWCLIALFSVILMKRAHTMWKASGAQEAAAEQASQAVNTAETIAKLQSPNNV